jgi:hypothetical protein
MSRYLPSTTYLQAGTVALLFAAVSGYIALLSPVAYVPAGLLLLSSASLFWLYRRPAIEIHPTHLVIGDSRYSWNQIRALDHGGWVAPLVVRIGLQDKTEIRVIYPGDLESATMLLRELRRHADASMIDGVPHREYWRMEEEQSDERPARRSSLVGDKPKYPLLTPGEEDEIERLYQRLKSVGHLDSKDDQ